MLHMMIAARNIAAWVAVVFSLALFAAPLSAQEIPDYVDEVGGSTSNAQMYWLDFSKDEAVEINTKTDQSARTGLNSFAFFDNTCGATRAQDIIVADTNSNTLLRYPATKGLRTGARICGGPGQPACPLRPTGLSSNNENDRFVAVSTGAGNSNAGVWAIELTPQPCANQQPQFLIRGGNGLTWRHSGDNRDTSASRLVDTEHVHKDGGGLEKGQVLVLVESPPMIVRVNSAGIGQGSGGGTTAVPLLPKSFFGKNTPTSLAFVPGTAVEGLSEVLLVTLSNGEVRQLRFGSNGNGGVVVSHHAPLGNVLGLFQNPRGIAAAGSRGSEAPYVIVADQNRGQYFRVELQAGGDGSLSIVQQTLRSLRTPIQSPMGIAIHRDDNVVFISQCFQPITEPDETTGCIIANGFAQLHFSQLHSPQPPNASVIAELMFLRDKTDNSDRDADGMRPFELDGLSFQVPPECRGFPTNESDPRFGDDAGQPHLILIDVGLRNFFIDPLEFILVTEGLDLQGEEANCKTLHSRGYYHPATDGAGNPLPTGDPYTLFPTTFACQSPSRIIVQNFSPLLFCIDVNHRDRLPSNLELGRNEIFNPNVRRAIDEIKSTLGTLPDSNLASQLKSLVVSFTNPNMGTDQKAYSLAASTQADAGSLIVFRAKKDFLACQETSGCTQQNPMPGNSYAVLLRNFLWLAFYTWTTGALESDFWKPHAEFCEPIYEDPFNPDTFYPELPDVQCHPPQG
jgi:hypothetical protein